MTRQREQGPKGRKAFQEATVRHAVARLTDPAGSRRFLVADEVGLGKTLVAQGVLQHLAVSDVPLNVFYVCSSLTIAHQNRDNLLEVLPEEQRKAAVVDVDRPTLLPLADPSGDSAFTLFTLTPGTLPMKGSSRGRVDERAAIWCLLREGLPDAGGKLLRVEESLKLVQEATWREAVSRRSSEPMLSKIRGLAGPFIVQLRGWLQLPEGSDQAIVEAVLARLRTDPLNVVQSLRKRLARLGLTRLRPDLVILDEFQRFFELLEPFSAVTGDPAPADGVPEELDDTDEDAHGLLELLLGGRDDAPGPAILLLSATPYRPPAGGIDGAGLRHYRQFFRLLEFLYGDEARQQVPTLRAQFRRFGTLLREAAPGTTEVLTLRDDIQARLSKVVARTERVALLGADSAVGAPERRPAPLEPNDVRIYRHLWGAADPVDRSYATPYWSSIPYPLQMLDQQYLLRKRATPGPVTGDAAPTVLAAGQVRRYEHVAPPHPRMRALLSEVGGPMLGLPWLPPSLPWWPLAGVFKDAASDRQAAGGASKTLLFSRFRAVPRAVASLVSFESERRVYGDPVRGRSYDYRSRGRGGREDGERPEAGLSALPAPSFTWQARLRESGERELDHRLLSLFVPAPTLSRLGDPQDIPGFSEGRLRRSEALEFVTKRLRDALLANGVVISNEGRQGQAWRALLRLERAAAETWAPFTGALAGWATKSGSQGAKAVARAWLEEAQAAGSPLLGAPTITESDLAELAPLALYGPGVVLYRAVGRVFGPHVDAGVRLRRCADIALDALRPYLDEPEFHLSLSHSGRGVPNHPAAVRDAMWHGNFESVLDEYFAVHAGLGVADIAAGREAKALNALEQALSVRVSTIRVQSLESPDSFSLRCHTAMPFGLTVDKDESRGPDGAQARPDALRHAFNSPFRPYLLATTSIGQEGLDFHVYCDRLVHWDLPASPVDLEQRDGRINRFGGLSVRKVMAKPYVSGKTSIPDAGSPWLTLTRSLEETCSGMAPWWGMDGAKIHRVVFLPPLARQEGELELLLAGLSHYRLALGQPDPEQLLRALHRKLAGAATEAEKALLHAWLVEARINLSPPGPTARAAESTSLRTTT